MKVGDNSEFKETDCLKRTPLFSRYESAIRRCMYVEPGVHVNNGWQWLTGLNTKVQLPNLNKEYKRSEMCLYFFLVIYTQKYSNTYVDI
mgnify:CR=1 FL=1